ncbi:MAG: hypothetical protein O7E52_08040, partial [Candidatus Poribacteria bacterium]|nr:hypothetical protein [Candidatus Poribacteria bacterium]
MKSHLQLLTPSGAYVGFDSDADVLYMGNRLIDRWIDLSPESAAIQTIRYTYKPPGHHYVDRPSEEFRFRIGAIDFSGAGELLTYDAYQISQKPGGVKQVAIQLTYTSAKETKPTFHLWVHYELYPDLPIIRKWLEIQNLTDSAFYVEDVAVESLSFFASNLDSIQIWRCELSSLSKAVQFPPWEGGATDAFILVEDISMEGGVMLGNESPGILKYYQVFSDRDTVSVGLTPTTATNGFEIRVPPKGTVRTPKVWTMLFQGNAPAAIDALINDAEPFVLPCGRVLAPQQSTIRWTQLSPEWDMPAEMLKPGEVIGVDYDWALEDVEVLKRISQQVHQNGGQFGIRLPLAEIRTDVLDRRGWRLTPAPVLRPMSGTKDEETPGLEMEGRKEDKIRSDAETAIQKDRDTEKQAERGKAKQHAAAEKSENYDRTRVVYCVLSDYGYYFTQAVKALIKETEADLLVFDRPLLGPQRSVLKGCNALGHEHYTRAESIGLIYRWVFEFADHLHQEHPNLQLGITATAYGVARSDAACLTHFD